MPDPNLLANLKNTFGESPKALKPLAPDKPGADFFNSLLAADVDNPSITPERRIDTFLTEKAAKQQSWSTVEPEFKQKFGDAAPDLGPHYELQKQKAYYSGKEPNLIEYGLLRSTPIVSSFGTFGMAKDYKAARERMVAGKSEPDDAKTIARYERLQELEAKQQETTGGAARSSLAHIPAMLGEALLTEGVGNEVKGLVGAKRLGRAAKAGEGGEALEGLGLRNIPAAEAAPATARYTATDYAAATGGRVAGTKETAGFVGGKIGGNLAQTAAMPSMYLPQSAERAIEKGGDWSDVDNLGRSYAIANLQVAVLGRLGPAGDAIPAGGPGAFGTRLAVRTGTGMIEQQAVDSIAQAVGLQERKGTLYEAVNGQPGSLKNATTEAITFAAFSLMHGAPQKKGLKPKPLEIDPAKAQQAVAPVVETIDALKAQGQTPQQIGDTMQGVHSKVDAALVADPTLTKDQARKLFANDPPEIQKYAEVKIGTLPDKKVPIQDSSLAPREAVLKELGRQKGNEALLKITEEMTSEEGNAQQQREHAKQVAAKLPEGNLKRYAKQLVEQAFGKEPAKSVEPVKPSSDWTDPNAVVEPSDHTQAFDKLSPAVRGELAQTHGVPVEAFRSGADPAYRATLRKHLEEVAKGQPSFPKSVTVETRPSRKTLDGERLDVHTIHDESGKMIGDIHLVPRGKELNVQWVGAKGVKAGEVSNVVGRKNLRSLLEQIAAKYPDAEYLTGTRIGGARMHAGKTDQRVNVSLPGRGPQRRKGEPIAVEKPPESPPDDPFNAPGLAGLLRKPAGEAGIAPEAPKPADLPPQEATPPKPESASVVPEQNPVVPAGDVPSKGNTLSRRVDGRKNVPPTEMARERVADLLRESGVAIKQAEDLLARFDGKTLEEIGKARGVSKQAVDSNIVKALTKLELDRADIDQVLNDGLTARGAGILERTGSGRVLPNELRVDPKETKKHSRQKQDAGEREIKRLDDLLEKLDKGELSREDFDAELKRIADEQQPARPAGADRPGPRAEASPERPQAPVEPPAKEARVETPAPAVAERSIMDVFDKGSESLKDHVEAQLSNLGLSLDMLPGYARESEDHARHVGRRLVSSWIQMVEEKAPAKDVRDLEAIMHKAVPDLKPVGNAGDKVGYDGLFHEGIRDVFTGDKVEIVRTGWSIKDDKGHEHVILKAEAKPSSSFLGSEVQGNLFGKGTRAPLPAKKGSTGSLVTGEMEAKANAEAQQARMEEMARVSKIADEDVKIGEEVKEAERRIAAHEESQKDRQPGQSLIDAIKELGGIRASSLAERFGGEETKAAFLRDHPGFAATGVVWGKPVKKGLKQKGVTLEAMAKRLADDGHIPGGKTVDEFAGKADVGNDAEGQGPQHLADVLMEQVRKGKESQLVDQKHYDEQRQVHADREFVEQMADPAERKSEANRRVDNASQPRDDTVLFAPPSTPSPAGTPKAGPQVGQHDIVQKIRKDFDVPSYRDTPPFGSQNDAAYWTKHMAQITGNMAAGSAQKGIHEAAHHLATKFKLPDDPAQLGPGIAAGFKQFDYVPNRPNVKVAIQEGFAEWMRKYATDDLKNLTKEQQDAAFFAETFLALHGQARKLDGIREQFRDFAKQDAVQKAAGELSGTGSIPEPKDTLVERVKNLSHQIDDSIWDDLAVWDRVEADRVKSGLAPTPADRNPRLVYSQLRMRNGDTAAEIEQKGYFTIQNGKRVFTGRGLDHVLEPWTKEDMAPLGSKSSFIGKLKFEDPKRISKAEVFLIANHVLGEVSRGKRPVSQDQIDLFQEAMNEFMKDPEFMKRAMEGAKRYTENMNDGLRALASPEIHRLEPDQVDYHINDKPDYVPLYRIKEQENWQAVGGRSKGEFMPNPVKARKGSGEQILSPFVSLRMKSLERASQINEQMRRNAAMELLLGGGLGKYALPGMEQQVADKAGNVYDTHEPWPTDGTKPSFWWAGPGGKMTNVRIGDRALYDLLTNQQVESSQLAKLARAYSGLTISLAGKEVRPVELIGKLVRGGATAFNLGFQLKNVPRDIYTFLSNTQSQASVASLPKSYGQMYLYELAKLFQMVSGKDVADPVAKLFAEGRGGQLRQFAFEPSRPQSAYDKTQGGVIRKARNLVDIGKQLLTVAGAGELGPRYQEFKNELKKRGWDEGKLRTELNAAEAQRKAGGNYVEPVPLGDLFAAYDAAAEVTVPFGRQGTLTRELNKITPFFGPGVAGLSKQIRNWKTNPKGAAAAMGVLIGLRLLYWSMYHDEDWYGELSDYDRYNNFVVPIPGMGLRRLPGPRGLEVGTGGTLTSVLDASVGKNPRVAGLVSQSLQSNLPPGIDRPVGSLVKGDYASAAGEAAVAPLGPAGETGLDLIRNKDFTGRPIVPQRDEDLPMRTKVAEKYLPYAVQQLSGGRGEPTLRGAGLEPIPQVKPKESVNVFYDTLKSMESERELAKKRGLKFVDEKKYEQMKKAEAKMTKLNAEARGEKRVGDKTVKIPVPDEQRKDEIRKELIRLAKEAMK